MNSTLQTTVETVLCGYTEECPFSRFAYVSIGGLLALFGIFSNLLLFYIFLSKTSSNQPSNFYPAVLAILDCLLCFAYILLFVIDVNMVYLQNEELFLAYHAYIVHSLVFSKMNQLAIPYLLILATLERFAWVAQRFKKNMVFRPAGRQLTVLLTVVLCVFIRIPAFFALKVETYPRCQDPMRRLAVAPTLFAQESVWMAWYDMYFIVIIQSVVPFVALIALNIIIVGRLANHDAASKNAIVEDDEEEIEERIRTISTGQPPVRKMARLERRRSMGRVLSTLKIHKMPSTVRNAVYTMVTIVTTYLLSNSLHLILMLLEKSEASILFVDGDPYQASTFYTILGDLVSISYMGSSAIRIIVYAVCNPTIRQQMSEVLLGSEPDKLTSDQRDSLTSAMV